MALQIDDRAYPLTGTGMMVASGAARDSSVQSRMLGYIVQDAAPSRETIYTAAELSASG